MNLGTSYSPSQIENYVRSFDEWVTHNQSFEEDEYRNAKVDQLRAKKTYAKIMNVLKGNQGPAKPLFYYACLIHHWMCRDLFHTEPPPFDFAKFVQELCKDVHQPWAPR
jgi:hypothetical protein